MKKKSHRNYTLNNQVLEQVPSNPYLGLQISEDLKWKEHINNVTKKANSTLGFLRRNLQHCPRECRKTAYIALVRSIMEYGAIIWDPYTKQEITKLESIQRRGARFITKDYKSREEGTMTRMLNELELPSLQDRRKQQRLIFFYKVVEGHIPAIPTDSYIKFQRNKRNIKPKTFDNFESSNIIRFRSRNNSRPVEIPNSRSEQHRNSFFIRTASDWNQLSDKIVCAKKIEEFKNAIQQHHD